jgi:hypothetical protein
VKPGGLRRFGIWLLLAAIVALVMWWCLAGIALLLPLVQPIAAPLFLSGCALGLLVLAFWYPVADAWRDWRARKRQMATRR